MFTSHPPDRLERPSSRSRLWFAIGLIGILGLSIALRFWGLSRFNTLVFDEVYYAKYAIDYLQGRGFFDAHPPLGKFAIALGIWLSQFFPFDTNATNSLAGATLNPASYRWLNAWIGSWIPLAVAGIAYQLNRRYSYALLAGFLAALEGMLLVESRYALINIYMIFFGTIGHWLVLSARDRSGSLKLFYLLASGLCLGAAVAVKWNGLGFLAGIYILYFLQQFFAVFQQHRIFLFFPKITIVQFILNFAIVPALIYTCVWIPHLQIDRTETLKSVHTEILAYHQNLGTGRDVHPYCSSWDSWLVMQRPVSYFHETTETGKASILPPPPDRENRWIYTVHLLGNPAIIWSSTGAVFYLILSIPFKLISARLNLLQNGLNVVFSDVSISTYIMINYAVNFLPWMKVSRCTFVYLYMSALIFGILAIAWLLDRGLHHPHPLPQVLSTSVIYLVVMAFVFWLPFYLGLPLSSDAWQQRIWFNSWI
jgi:dolichyl-phosphate-mannose-protein mannosyltransferase